jgi:competence protein ComFC
MVLTYFKNLFIRISDTIFPPSDDLRIVRTLTAAAVTPLLQVRDVYGATALTDFRDPRVRALIHEAKFHGNRKAFQLLGTLVERYLSERTLPYDIIVPIPLSAQRRRTRGYNQVYEVLRTYTACALIIAPKLLTRVRDTKPQTDLDRDARLSNVKNAFAVTHNPGHLTGKHIILVDDVMTTGATLHEAQRALLLYDPGSVTLLALAH